MTSKFPLLASLLFAVLLVTTFPVSAQLNNKPFSFKTPDGGVGMSTGGMQAIINQKVLGVTPENMVRAPDGSLLDVTKGPGGSAFVSTPDGGGIIPGYKGTGWKGNNSEMGVGVFNAYFSPGGAIQRTSFDSTYAHVHAGAVVSTWTGRVVSGQQGISYLPGNSVDAWTSMP